ncbi:MAG: acetolactate synthase small subunit [Clostridia bacterium]|nr:acetolactate synthase small subunit [Oscillospiraceae bacterium]MBQ4518460.1 acetolactate synthase small subunit [Clostridia bacterium]
MPKYTTAILVRNQFGVLNRVTSMFRRRQFNINSLTVSETESDSFSRITITYEGDNELHHQIVSQLYKLPDVSKVKELDSDESVTCELMLIKVKNDAATREDIRTAADAYKAETVDYTHDSIIMRIAGDSRRIDAFIALMREYSILEICRTGVVALERGSKTILEIMD